MNKTVNNSRYIKIAAGFLLFALIAFAMKSGLAVGFDNAVRDAILNLRCDILNKFFVPFAYSGNAQVVIPLCALLLLIPKTRFTYGLPMSVSAGSAQLFYQVLKRIFRRERPDYALHLVKEHGFSFPSGHSITSFLLFAMLLTLLVYYHETKGKSLPVYKKEKPCSLYPHSEKALNIAAGLCVFYIVFMGIARVYVGVHWPTDVLASWSLGLSVITILRMIFFGHWGRS